MVNASPRSSCHKYTLGRHDRALAGASHEASQHAFARNEVECSHTINGQNGGSACCSVRACTACAAHSHPAFVVSAHWNGAVAASTASLISCAIVRATTLMITSPATMSPTPPDGFCNKPFWLKLCCSRARRVSLLRFLPSLRRGFMPRRGWSVAPDGWVQIIRGPRPPSVRWPQAPHRGQNKPQHVFKKEANKGSTQPRPQQHSPPLQQPSHSPESVAASATAEVSRSQSAISVLGEDNPHAKPLLEALKVAKNQATIPPI